MRHEPKGKVLLAALGAALLLPAAPARALAPELPLNHALLETWTSSEGLPLNRIYSVISGPDGYLWVGTEQGLLRFDGIRFTAVEFTGRVGPAPEVNDFAFDAQGDGWIATKTGLFHLHPTAMTAELAAPVAARALHEVEVDRQGVVWAWLGGAKLTFLESGGKLGELASPAFATVHQLVRDGDDMLVASDSGLTRVTHGAAAAVALPAACAGPVMGVASSEGDVWVAAEGGKALCRIHGGTAERVAEESDANPGDIRRLSVDSHGALWATTTTGVWRYYHGAFSALGPQHGLPSTAIRDVEEDAEGSIWLATLEGLCRLRDTPFMTLGKGDGLRADLAEQIRRTPDGTLWVGALGNGLYRERGGGFAHYGTAEGLPSEEIRALGVDAQGTLLVGTKAGAARLEGDRFVSVPFATPAESGTSIYAFHTEGDGTTWAFGYDGAFVLRDGTLQAPPAEAKAPADHLFHAAPCADGSVWAFSLNTLYHLVKGHFEASPVVPGLGDATLNSGLCRPDEVWVGTELAGLVRYANGAFTRLSPDRGAPSQVNGLVTDAAGEVWISSIQGLFRTTLTDLDGAAADPHVHLTTRLFDVADGLKNREFNTHGEPFAWTDADGTIWLPNIKGAVHLDPAHVPHNPRPPPVRIEALRVDEHPVPLGPDPLLPPGSKAFAIDYTGLSLVVPNRVHFRYRLEGVDATWVDAGGRRTAYYTNLAPGPHRFEVQASNDDGVWSEHPATLLFNLEPTFRQTELFTALCALAVLLGFGLIYWLRTRQLERQKEELELLVQLRTRDLAEAMGRAERLLLNVLPAPIAERLKANEGAIADHFEQVTILFADIVGFTTMSAHTSPDALVALLNDLFTRFDALAVKHGVEKIKTIGDCYMAVTGVPVARADHAEAMAAMGIDMLAELESFNKARGTSLRIRIGINSGPVVAGVIGKSKFIYDLWGDAVNTASRMESHGDPGSIHMSEITAQRLAADFVVEDRGMIHVKGKGDMRTFFLRGRKAAPPPS